MVSIALCTYNGDKFLEDQLKSILSQINCTDEIIICDDCSIDNTPHILNMYLRDFPEIIKIYKNDIRIGAKMNFEKALLLCKGDFIFLSDQDDIWEQDKVKKILSYFNSHLDKLAVFTNAKLINNNGNDLKYTLWDCVLFSRDFRKEMIQNNSNNIFEYLLNYGNIATGATIAIKKEAVCFVTPFNKDLLEFLWHDEWIALRLSSENKIGFIDECLIKYRLHDSQQVGVSLDTSIIKELRNINNRSLFGPFLVHELFNYVSFYYYMYKKIIIIEKYGVYHLKLKNQTYKKFTEAKKRFLQQDFFLKKKLRLFKWWLKNDYYTELLDLFRF
jgi:glycosyltransferase involved in cell wall biosynthesis